jgi:hypothetical protein
MKAIEQAVERSRLLPAIFGKGVIVVVPYCTCKSNPYVQYMKIFVHFRYF